MEKCETAGDKNKEYYNLKVILMSTTHFSMQCLYTVARQISR